MALIRRIGPSVVASGVTAPNCVQSLIAVVDEAPSRASSLPIRRAARECGKPAQYRIRTGRRIGSAALVADGLHARTDGLTSLGVLLGAAGVALGFQAADPIMGLLITAAILFVLKDAARSIYYRLMDAVDPELVERGRSVAGSVAGVQRVDELRLRWIGHRLHAEAEVTVDPELPMTEAHTIAHAVHHALLHEVPRLDQVVVHTSPASDDGTDPHGLLAHHQDGQPHHHE